MVAFGQSASGGGWMRQIQGEVTGAAAARTRNEPVEAGSFPGRAPTAEAKLLALQRTAGNRAVAGLLQRSPAQWVGSPEIAIILNIDHGWFSTEWKPLKEEVRAYRRLAANDHPGRGASLARISTHIAAWRANPKHPAGSTDPRIH